MNARLAGDHLYGILLFTWLSLVMSLMVCFVLSFFSRDVLDGIWDLIESVLRVFPTYFCLLHNVSVYGRPVIRVRNVLAPKRPLVRNVLGPKRLGSETFKMFGSETSGYLL